MLDRLLSSIAESSIAPKLVVIVDNASPRSAASVVAARSNDSNFDLEVLEPGRNLGFAGAFNLGSQALIAAGCDLWANLSHDTVLARDTFAVLTDAAKKGADLVGPIVRDLNTKEVFSSGGFVNEWTGEVWSAKDSPTETRRVDWLDGSCFVIKKNLFEALSGMNEDIFLYFEDVDLGLRAKRLGAKPTVALVDSFQEPTGPSAYLRGHSSGVLARTNLGSPLFFSLIARNVAGSAISFLKGCPGDGFSRMRGLSRGLMGQSPAY